MSLINNELSKAVRLALTLGAAAGMVASTAAIAQDDDKELDTITVVGSRIKRVDVETSQPVFTLEKEDIKATGLTSIGDVIQNITTNGSTLNTTQNNGGNGETRVSLRNLGSNRTLVLVNGHRWVAGTGLGGAVDLNTIPTAAVERIEVLKDGASSIYGSDAIAGVVNIILRTDYDGAEANLEVGEFEDGDGMRQSYDFTIGTSTEKGSLMFTAGYVQEDPVFAGDREISKEPVTGTGNSFGSGTSPFGRFAICRGVYNPIAATCTGGALNQPNGQAGTFTYDPGQSGTNFRTFRASGVPNDFYNFAPDNYLLTPQERTSIFTSGSYNFSDNLRFTTMAVYNERKSEQLLAAIPITLGTAGSTAAQRAITISPNSIFNPFGFTVARINRRAVETGGRLFEQNVDSYAFNGTFEGNFDFFDRGFSWDAGYTYAENEQHDTENGQFELGNLARALGPSEIRNGVPVCVTAPGGAIIPRCVPINFLGAPGTMTPEALAYSTFTGQDSLGYEMVNYFANLTGDVFELPAGPLAFAAGYEYRKEQGFDQPDAIVAQGNTTGNSRTPTRGAYSLDEWYLEVNIPILKDIPFFNMLEVSLATRYSDYSNFGDTTNSKAGFKWKPIDDLLIRGNWAEGFRAPAIGELFAGQADSFPPLTDRCANAGVPGAGNQFANLTPEQQQRCIAAGVPAGGYDQVNSQIRITVGGNPNLLPEKSVSKTLGLVYSPGWVEGLDVALDWWNIKIDDTISGLGGQTIVDLCILSNDQGACALITRGAAGNILDLLSAGLNLGSSEVEGWDMTVSYRLPEFSFGQFSLVWDSTYMSSYFVQNFADSPRDSLVGEYYDRNNFWRVRSNLNVRWELGDWGAAYGLRYFSRQEEEICDFPDSSFAFLCNDPDGPNFVPAGEDIFLSNKIGGTTYHDIQFSWNAPWNARVAVGINNFTDKDPPFSINTFANSFDPQYEVPGRFWYAQYTQRF